MHRTKLQELCHQRKWALPKYSCMRDGPDHCPRFKASVIVNGDNFDTETICKSSKEACNEAAKLAFLHFTSGHSEASDQEEEVLLCPKVYSHASDIKHELPHGYKMKLQIYAQRKNLGLPLYHCKREGPPDALCFKGVVTIAGESFESLEAYKNVEDAEAAAAQIALFSSLTNAFAGKNFKAYKNHLQELTQREGWLMPTYKTINSVDRHDLTFISTVGVEGETFSGKAAKSKKQAELNAAMVAYTALTQRKSPRTNEFSHTSSDGEAVKIAPQVELLILSDPPQGKSKTENLSSSTSLVRHELRVKESKGENLNSKCSPQDTAELSGNRKIEAPLQPLCFSPKGSQSSSATTTLPDLSAPSISGPGMKNTGEIKSYLLCNKVRVYTSIPGIALPKGTVLLPIADNKWVFVCLEFKK